MDRTDITEPQIFYITSIFLIPLWTERALHTLSACTVHLYRYSPYGQYALYISSVPVQYSVTSIPPIGRPACTDPQCLYIRPKSLHLLWTVRPLENLSACTVHINSTPTRARTN